MDPVVMYEQNIPEAKFHCCTLKKKCHEFKEKV